MKNSTTSTPLSEIENTMPYISKFDQNSMPGMGKSVKNMLSSSTPKIVETEPVYRAPSSPILPKLA